MGLPNITFQRRRNERLRREEAQRAIAIQRERSLMQLAQGITTALMAGQAQADAARGDGAFAFSPASSGSAH